jgi:hypothetical protein
LRWTNYLRPDIKRGRFSLEEEQTIVHLHAILGNRWSAIASHLPRRTDNEIKNYWNTHLKKRLLRMGIDPVTHQASPLTLQDQHYHHLHLQGVHHRRRLQIIGNSEWKLAAAGSSSSSNYLTHMSQWDCMRAEAEARLASTNLNLLSSNPITTTTITTCNNPMQDAGFRMQSPPSPHDDLYATSPLEFFWNPSFGVVEHVKGLRPLFSSNVDDATVASGASTTGLDVDFRAHLEERMSKTSPSCSPVNLQKFLQDWDSSLQPASQNLQTCLTESCVSTDHTGHQESPCSTQYTTRSFQPVAHCEILDAAPEQIQRSSSELFQGTTDNFFSVDQYNDSPPSVSEASNSRSPRSSTIAAASESGLLLPAPIHQESDDQKLLLSDIGVSEVTTFWQRQQAAMVEAGLQRIPDQYNILPELVLTPAERPLTEFEVPNNLSHIPQFEFLCRGPADQNKLLSFESMALGRTIL